MSCVAKHKPDRSSIRTSTATLKIPGLDPGPATRRVTVREEPAQAAIVAALRRDGYRVLETDRRRDRSSCRRCGAAVWTTQQETDRAVPDLLIMHDRWPVALAFLLEVKGSDTPVSVEQAGLYRSGRIDVLRAEGSVSEAVDLARERLRAFEEGAGLV